MQASFQKLNQLFRSHPTDQLIYSCASICFGVDLFRCRFVSLWLALLPDCLRHVQRRDDTRMIRGPETARRPLGRCLADDVGMDPTDDSSVRRRVEPVTREDEVDTGR